MGYEHKNTEKNDDFDEETKIAAQYIYIHIIQAQ